jgi:tetratricopeptide (TPR) repeat protein
MNDGHRSARRRWGRCPQTISASGWPSVDQREGEASAKEGYICGGGAIEKSFAIRSKLTYHRVTVVATATRPKIAAGIELASKPNAWLDPSRLHVIFKFRRKAACALAIALSLAGAAVAQKSRGGGPPPPPPDPLSQGAVGLPEVTPDPFATTSALTPDVVVSGDAGRMIDAESCSSWTESGVHSPTVSAKRLAVPSNASSEYQKACGAFKGKRFPDAEEHLHKAIEFYPDYPAAWVVLGQVLESEKKADEAQEACSKARDLDPGYVASYLCLSEFAANDSDWTRLAKLSEQALALDPVGNPYALYFAADAGLHFNQLTQAEMHAQSAVKLDEWHHLPQLHLLLAQIYEAAGNTVGEVVQLREFLKMAGNSKDAPKARSILAQLDAPPAKDQPGKDQTAPDRPTK